MSNTRERLSAAGVALAGGFFRLVFYVLVIVAVIALGKESYEFGYTVFNQKAVSPDNGQEITVVISDTSSAYQVGKTLQAKGLIEDPMVFAAQEMLSNYHGKMRPGTYLLSTAYDPNRIMSILSGEGEEES